ncbi:acyltransferase family protein [bacterium]|nr:acyltransferase family protein [bacterium]
MRKLFQLDPLDFNQLLSQKGREKLLYKVFPYFFAELASKYFRVEVQGAEHLPKRGGALICPNHSGVSGFDAMVLHHEIQKAVKRYPRVLTHKLWFVNKTTAIPAQKLGFIEATLKNGLESLDKNQLVVLFPEGEQGNFKPSSRAYQLQEFRRGFVRMAIETGKPIIPTLILGAEETHINLSQLKLTKYVRGLILPLPLNILPLPSKWKILFLDPIQLPYPKSKVNDRNLILEIAEDIQEMMQKRLIEELNK